MAIVVNGVTTVDERAASTLPKLFVRTVGITQALHIAHHIPAAPTALWLHERNGAVGLGEALRIETTGASRFRALSSAFAAVAEASEVSDEVRTRGSGLTAFGSFSYADTSTRPSRLLVPELTLGTRDGETFLTFASPTPLGVIDDNRIEEALRRFTPAPRVPVGHVDMTPAHSPEAYRALVSHAIRKITEGEALKVVLSERFHVDVGDVQVRDLVPGLATALNARYPGAWTYMIDDIIGASPEMLVRTEESALFSRVLAGSRPVAGEDHLSEDERRAFHSDPKERSEHDFAVRSVTEPLRALTSTLHVSAEPFVLQLPGIEHLASDVTARLAPGVKILDVVQALHPSAAVSGTPRHAAGAIISELEGTDRAGYASPVGWINASGDGEWAIALRMAHMGTTSLTVHAGGGIVRESDPLTEHAEALAKTRPIIGALHQL